MEAVAVERVMLAAEQCHPPRARGLEQARDPLLEPWITDPSLIIGRPVARIVPGRLATQLPAEKEIADTLLDQHPLQSSLAKMGHEAG